MQKHIICAVDQKIGAPAYYEIMNDAAKSLRAQRIRLRFPTFILGLKHSDNKSPAAAGHMSSAAE
jgi:hypothetical protein